ncbi:MAG TPA: M13 family metallopeptidase [Myxococcaceae bacterium]|nr:M13 family metallopeptidase [Myxococcaceae bacterium]
MPIRPLSFSLLAFGLACASSTPRPSPAAGPSTADAGAAMERPAAPDAGTHGIDVTSMDPSVAPGDDFFEYANGGWLRRTEIPADVSRWGTFSVLNAKSVERTRDILEAASSSSAPAGSEERKVGDFYASYLDEATIEARGIAPLGPELAAIAALKDKTALARAMGKDLRTDVDALNNTYFHTSRLFGLWVAPDMNRPSVHAAYLFQGGLGMPDREYYLSDNPKMAAARDAYRTHVARVLELAGISGGAERAARILALEMQIARVHATRAESLEVRKANNPWRRSEFARRAPGLDWTAFFSAAGLQKVPGLIVWHPRAVHGLAALVKKVPLATWKDWMTFHAVDRQAPLLPRAFVAENFEFYGKTLAGTPELSARWKRAVEAVGELRSKSLGFREGPGMGNAVGKLYVQAHFPASAKAQIQEMVRQIAAAFDRRIEALDWMAPATKAQAREKVRTLYVGVGYPDRWVDYSSLEISRDDLIGNVQRVSLFDYRRHVAQLGKPVDRSDWCMEPQTVNAVNLPLQNALNFPAAILQPPFFDPLAPDAANYGAIGQVIGHEISHSFDDQGAMFDAGGRLRNWWTPADFAHFEKSGARLAAQYDAYQPFPDMHVNGKLTLSENIADVAGLAAAHDGWLASLGGREAPSQAGFTGEQQLFIAFAQNWRAKTREPLARQLLITDGHSPDHYRALTVRNIDAWYPAFGVKEGQKLYLSPEQRVRVW